MEDKKQLLESILRLEDPGRLDALADALRQAGWDSPEGELVQVTAGVVTTILERYLSEELSARQVEDWANLIERREDVTFGESMDEERVIEVIDCLANPVLEGALTPSSARELIVRLSSSSG